MLSMQLFGVVLGLTVVAMGGRCLGAQVTPYATWTLDVPKQASNAEKSGVVSVIFADNEHLAALGFNAHSSQWWLAALQVSSTKISNISETTEPVLFQHAFPVFEPIHRAVDGHLLVFLNRVTFPELAPVQLVDLSRGDVSRDGSLLGFRYGGGGLNKETGTWCIRTYAAEAPCTVSGTGQLLAFGPQGVIVRTTTSVRIIDLQQNLLGEIKLGKSCWASAEYVSNREFLLQNCKETGLSGFDGKLRLKLARLSPMGKVQASDDGSRLLLVRPSRHVTVLKNLTEGTVAVATLGVGVEDQADNRTLFTVIDTVTGRECFTYLIKNAPYSAHPTGDLSPDGSKVVIGFRDKVQVFRVSDLCF